MERDGGARDSQREQPRWEWWLCGAGLVSAIIIITSLLSPYIRHQWALSLSGQNARYTELAFNRAAALPVTAVRGKSIQISFTITNDEGTALFYRYVVASGSGSKLKLVSSSSKTVPQGAAWRVNRLVVPKCAQIACRVQVSLPQQGERIDFILMLKEPIKSSRGSN